MDSGSGWPCQLWYACCVNVKLRDVHVVLGLLLRYNGSKNYGGVKLGV